VAFSSLSRKRLCLQVGHKDVNPTLLYADVLNRGPAAVRSPANEQRGTERLCQV
jgi:hypothetical protein